MIVNQYVRLPGYLEVTWFPSARKMKFNTVQSTNIGNQVKLMVFFRQRCPQTEKQNPSKTWAVSCSLRLRQPCRNDIQLRGSWLGRLPYTEWNQNSLQVRGVDRTPYQSWHSPLRWAISYAHGSCPLRILENRSFTFYIYSDVTHTETLHKIKITEVICWELNPINHNRTRF